MRVSVILPVYNVADTIAACLSSIFALNFPKDDYEVVLVDNNSSDATADIAANFPVIYLCEKRQGGSFALMAGVARARGAILAFTHGDCIVDRDWLMHLVAGLDNPAVAACGGSVDFFGQDLWLVNFCKTFQKKYEGGHVSGVDTLLPWIDFVNTAVRRDLFVAEGGVDAASFKLEYEIDFSFRLVLKGYHLSYVKQALVSHLCRRSFWAIWARFFCLAYYGVCFVNKYGAFYTTMYRVPYRDPFFLVRSVVSFFKNILTCRSWVYAGYYVADLNIRCAFWLGSMCGFVMSFGKKGASTVQPFPFLGKVFSWVFNEKTVLYNSAEGRYYVFSGLEGELYAVLRSGVTLDVIAEQCLTQYDVDAKVMYRDVQAFAHFLSEKSLI